MERYLLMVYLPPLLGLITDLEGDQAVVCGLKLPISEALESIKQTEETLTLVNQTSFYHFLVDQSSHLLDLSLLVSRFHIHSFFPILLAEAGSGGGGRVYISVGNTDPDFTSQLSPRVLARGGTI